MATLQSRRRFTIFPRGRSAWRRVGIMWGGLLVLLAAGASCMISMPGRSWSGALPPLADDERLVRDRLHRHVDVLAGLIGERNLYTPAALARAAEYIERDFVEAGYTPVRQEFRVLRDTACNIEAELRGATRPEEILVVGGHYDSVCECPGANDNGTGVAGVLEIARLLAKSRPARTIRFVAFVNEEPPYFQTSDMGSVVYARRCAQRGEKIVGMISLETIGYYRDEKGTQQYPFPFSLVYPSRGNFVAFVGNLNSRTFVRSVVRSFRQQAKFPSEGIAGPESITGVGWSDHWSFWQSGYPALMVTDTAPFRYPHYHSREDTPDKIDYERTARVVAGLARVVAELAQ